MKLNKLMAYILIILELYVVIINISAAINTNGYPVVEINNGKLEIENNECISATLNRGEYFFFEVMEILNNNQKESDYFGIG